MKSWEFPELNVENSSNKNSLQNIDRLKEIDVNIEAVLGSCDRKIYDVMNFQKEDIILLDAVYGSLVDIRVNGSTIGKGEVVVVEDQLGIRIKHLSK